MVKLKNSNLKLFSIKDSQYYDQPSYFDVVVKNDSTGFADFLRTLDGQWRKMEDDGSADKIIFADWLEEALVNSPYDVELWSTQNIGMR